MSKNRKLVLSRESVKLLSPASLEEVQGGMSVVSMQCGTGTCQTLTVTRQLTVCNASCEGSCFPACH